MGEDDEGAPKTHALTLLYHLPKAPDARTIVSAKQKRLRLRNAMRPLLRAARIDTLTGRLPRVHDFRHTFAIQALLLELDALRLAA
jgi:integrase